MSKHAPSVNEIVALLKRSGLSLYEEGKAGIKVLAAGNSVLVGEFNEHGIQLRPGIKLQMFLDDLPARYFSPSQARQVVKPGAGSAGESQRKFTSIRARMKAKAADPSSYLGFQVLDKNKPNIPQNLVNLAPSAAHSDTPRVITYVKKVKRADGVFDYVRHIIFSEAYIDTGKRVDEVQISYTLTGAELELFDAPNFDHAAYLDSGGFSALGADSGLEVRGLHLQVHDPNLEFMSASEAAKHFEKTSEYLQRIAKALFDDASESYLKKIYDIPNLRPLDWVVLVAHDQVRTKEWVKLGAKGVSTATLGKELAAVQEAIIGQETYRRLDDMTRTLVSMSIYMDPEKGWELLKPEVVLGGKYRDTDKIAEAVAELIEKHGPDVLEFIKHLDIPKGK